MRVRGVVLHVGLLMTLAMTLTGTAFAAQGGSADPSARLLAVLPATTAKHVIALVKTARAEGLPGDALANRSLKFAARGIAPTAISKAADEQLTRMRSARDVLRSARGVAPSAAEIEAGAEALREGVGARDVASLAKSAPSGRSLAVPLYVVGSLVSSGVSSHDALQRVASKLQSRASDTDIEATGRDAAAASHRPAGNGRGDGAGSDHSGGVGAPAASPPGQGHGRGPPGSSPGNGHGHGPPAAPPGQRNRPHGHP